MLRLTQTPDKMHYLMIQGANRVVYNIQFQGPCAYGGNVKSNTLYEDLPQTQSERKRRPRAQQLRRRRWLRRRSRAKP